MVDWSIIAGICMTGLMELIVRSVYCARIGIFTGNLPVPVVIIVLCSLGEIASHVAFAIKIEVSLGNQFSALHSFSARLVFSIIADLVLAGTQVWLLYKRRGQVRSTNSIVRTLIVYSINTGVISSLCALIQCITWATMPNNLVYSIFFASSPKLLLNALLATLNARQYLREVAKGPSGILSIPLTSVAPSSTTAAVHATQDSGDAEVR
ncbi:hypothetical protein CERSUDRAFT_108682 [Gelatoporia subvermispora B]|uniref:DUF6534 domain-containing protein n=1 Tax=Ceriporiopsis subvermispora (strain B) TaxID=914234 RepID=M2R2T1_CERS8|nr:hypothetical protein CERSUDRAFT_108682 [Gelatoporia subvermispora B]